MMNSKYRAGLKRKIFRNYYLYPAVVRHCKRCAVEAAPAVEIKQQSIPKTIHYCWFGRNQDTEMKMKCMGSWKKYCPDYKLQLWNEDNFPFEDYPFAKQALEDKKWAYVSDVARLHSLYYFGGIYMDTDVQMFQPIDKFLNENFFSGYESPRKISIAMMGSRAGNSYLGKLLLWYIGKNYSKAFYDVPNVKIISKFTERFFNVKLDGQELSLLEGARFYPQEYFCRPTNGSKCIFTQHHFEGSWVNVVD